MTSRAYPPTWAILTTLKPDVLSGYASELPSTEVVRGSGKYSALVNSLPGSEGSDRTLAERISAAHPRSDIFLLRLAEDLEVVWVYRNGRRVREQDDDPWELARSLSCPLRPEPTPAPVTRSVCVVCDRTPDQVARALGYDEAPVSGPLHILACVRGSYFYSEKGNIALFRDDVAMPTGALVYLLSARDGGAEFYCSVMENGKDVGAYEIPVFRSAPLVQLSSIEERTEPIEIMEALGVPPAILGLV